MLSARRACLATILFLLSVPALVVAAEPALPDSAAAGPEVRERDLRARIAAHPGDVPLALELAQFYYDQGDRGRAEKQFRRVLELDPRNLVGLVRLGTVLNEAGKSDEALQQFDAALAIEPRNVDTLCRKGQALYAVKRQEEAVRLYLEAEQIDPNDQAPYYWLGIAFADAGIYREALVEWGKVVDRGANTELGRAAAEGMDVLRPMVGAGQ
jgi:tetratricopeptide (TPR) repeat protein